MGLFSWCKSKKYIQKEPSFEEGFIIFSNFIKQTCEIGIGKYIPFTIFISAFANYLRYIDSISSNIKYCYITYAHNHTYSFLKCMKNKNELSFDISPGFVSFEGVDTRVLIGITVNNFIMKG
jgi:hypothetical protein